MIPHDFSTFFSFAISLLLDRMAPHTDIPLTLSAQIHAQAKDSLMRKITMLKRGVSELTMMFRR